MSTENVPDAIEKQIHLKAPRARVWKALSDATQFGTWFGAEFDAPFAVGQRIKGRIRPTKVDPETAKLQEPHAGTEMMILVDRMDAERLFAFRWHPYGVDAKADIANEQTTLVTFELSDAPGGTLLKITESGFSKIPLERRATAFAANDGGWAHQLKLIEKYLQLHA